MTVGQGAASHSCTAVRSSSRLRLPPEHDPFMKIPSSSYLLSRGLQGRDSPPNPVRAKRTRPKTCWSRTPLQHNAVRQARSMPATTDPGGETPLHKGSEPRDRGKLVYSLPCERSERGSREGAVPHSTSTRSLQAPPAFLRAPDRSRSAAREIRRLRLPRMPPPQPLLPRFAWEGDKQLASNHELPAMLGSCSLWGRGMVC